MTMRFEQILADGVAECSYLLSDAAHICAVIDPRPDVEIYLNTAGRFGLAISHVLHQPRVRDPYTRDFMRGALADRLGEQAKFCVSAWSPAGYQVETPDSK